MPGKGCGKKGHRKHTPITTEKQVGFFGAEYRRAKEGKQRKTDMPKAELRRHLKEWGSKHTTLSPNLVGNEYLFDKINKH